MIQDDRQIDQDPFAFSEGDVVHVPVSSNPQFLYYYLGMIEISFDGGDKSWNWVGIPNVRQSFMPNLAGIEFPGDYDVIRYWSLSNSNWGYKVLPVGLVELAPNQ